MKKAVLIALLGVGVIQLSAQADNFEDKVLFTVADDTVTAGEYMAVYNKNRNLGEDIDPKTPREYLDLYVNFKLKVHEAKALGMDTVPSFLREYNSYRDQLAKPYLTDKDVTEDLIEEALDRMKQDVRASHIMIAVAPNATPADTLKAYNKLMDIKKKIKGGASFAAMAKENSDDTYSAQNGGDLGYFTVFNMVYPFEDAAYKADIGEMVGPIRTRFGYHLIKTTDKRPARGTIQVAHIMLIDNDEQRKKDPNAMDSKKVEQKINEIHQELENGADFATLAKQYSEDPTTKDKGGILYPFGINKMYPEFENTAFALKETGDYSEPVKTPIGWHIIKLVKPAYTHSEQEARAEIKEKLDRDQRAQKSRVSIIKKLKKEYGYKEYISGIKAVTGNVDESFLKGQFKTGKVKNADKTVFEFGPKEYTVSDVISYMEKNPGLARGESNLDMAIDKALAAFSEMELVAYEKSQLEKKYPEFRLLSREYFEGILLFDLTEDRVWKKSVTDSAGLHQYYTSHTTDYMWKDRYNVIVVDAATEKLARKASKLLKKGKTMAGIRTELNEDSQLNVKLDSNLYEAGNLELLDKIEKKKELSGIIEKDGRYYVVDVLEIRPAQTKSFEEARGMVISDYQGYLEKTWIKDLKDKYRININQEVLKDVIEKLEAES